MRLAILKVGNRLLGYNDFKEIGAYLPGEDGNHYNHLILTGTIEPEEFKPGIHSWWANTAKQLEDYPNRIDPDFPFPIDKVQVVIIDYVNPIPHNPENIS